MEEENIRNGYILGLRPGYMRSLSDLPLLEALYKARVGLYAGPVLLYKGERKLIRHAVFFDEVCDYDRSAARDPLERGRKRNEGELRREGRKHTC